MLTVWRFPITNKPVQVLELPKGAADLRMSNGSLYAVVDPEAPKESVTIVLVRVGEPAPEAKSLALIGVIQVLGYGHAILRVSGLTAKAQAAFEATVAEWRKKKSGPKPSSSVEDEDEEVDEDE